MVRGSMVGLFIFVFLGLWNDLFWPLIVLSDRDMLTLPVGLLVIQQGSYIRAEQPETGGNPQQLSNAYPCFCPFHRVIIAQL